MASITSATSGPTLVAPTANGRGILWDAELEGRLAALVLTDMTFREIAAVIGTTEQGVKTRACKLGLKRDRAMQFARHSEMLRARFDSAGQEPKDIGAWKRRVLSRDKYTCVDCGLHCPAIAHAHHVEQRVDAPHRVLDVSNGVTVCPNCHATPRHVKIGRRSSGKRLSRQEKDYIYEALAQGRSRLEIATSIGVNVKTVDSVVKAKE